MSDSVQPQRRQPTRLPHPWDSPGKNTGVGCHFLLQCINAKSESEVAQSCRLLATPWTAAYQAPLSMGFSRQEHWSRVPLPSPLFHLVECFKNSSLMWHESAFFFIFLLNNAPLHIYGAFYLSISLSILMLVPHCFNYYSFVVNFEFKCVVLQTLFFVFKNSLQFHVQLKTGFSIH